MYISVHAVNHITGVVKMSYGRFSLVHISSSGTQNEQEECLLYTYVLAQITFRPGRCRAYGATTLQVM
jgi:hypothetical protein